jgi:endoglucanase
MKKLKWRIGLALLAMLIFAMAGEVFAASSTKYVKSVSISATKTNVYVGKSKKITVTVNTVGKVAATFTAKSKNTKVATVKVSGTKVKITGKKVGKTTITVTSTAAGKSGKKLSKKITVTVKPAVPANSAVAKHGALKVKGANLVDKNGKKFQLYGMSTHGINWFPEYVNYDSFKTLRDDWNTNCVRLAMYTSEYNGYCTGGSQAELEKLVSKGVNYATKLGMYVVIDWHVLNDQSPTVYQSQAISFFKKMSKKYKYYDNVIYEICNEPNGWADWASIKSYAEKVIPVIRANDPDAIIIVGTPTWSQEVDKALASPLSYKNIMYTLHFYADTHTDWLRSRLETCVKAGLPVFITEFGMCDASGSGSNNFTQAKEWMKLIKKYNLSYLCWNLSNKAETSSVIQSWCTKLSGWKTSELTEAGKWIRKQFRSEK